MNQKSEKRVFLDYASTTPVDPEVLSAMFPYFSEEFHNPSAIYKEGVVASEAVHNARLECARLLECRKEEIIFTGSGTESDNIALLGVIRKFWNEGKNHLITTTIEHPAVLEVAKTIKGDGGLVTYIPVSEDGIVNPNDIANAITEKTALVSVQLCNNEIGTIQPVREISRVINEHRKKHNTKFPYFHVDASQGANYLGVEPSRLGADLVTLDGQKIYGPKGVGLLFIRAGIEIEPIMWGGGQEKSIRPGTENVPAIVGFAKALSKTIEKREEETERLTKLRDYMIKEILDKIPKATLNGSSEKRLPNNVNVCLARHSLSDGGHSSFNSEFAVIQMDERGIACSAASSCRSLSNETYSYVIEALAKEECSSSSLRFTLGRGTTKKDLDRAIESLIEITC